MIKNLCQNTGKTDPATRGLSLVEVLVGAAIGAVVMLGTAKTLAVALQSSNIVRTIVTEQALQNSLNEALSGDDTGTTRNKKRENCARNLAPNNLVGTHKDKGVGTIKDGLFKVFGNPDPSTDADDPEDEKLISKGPFKENIEVVEMELIDPNPTASGPSDPKDEAGDENKEKTKVPRRLIVRYKKKNLGQLNTVGNKECSATNKEGCYFKICDVEYGLANGSDATDPDKSGANVVHTCNSNNDCFQYGEWTASKKYCAIKNCLTGGCDHWSDKKPKESEIMYSYIRPFYYSVEHPHFDSQIPVYYIPDKTNPVIKVMPHRINQQAHYAVAKVKSGGCCTIKKYYINWILKGLKKNEKATEDIENTGLTSHSRTEKTRLRMKCDSKLYNIAIPTLNRVIDSSISCSGIPKDIKSFFRFPTIAESQNENDIGKTCINHVGFCIYKKGGYCEDQSTPVGQFPPHITSQYNWYYIADDEGNSKMGINIPEWTPPSKFDLGPTFSSQ